MVAVAKRKPKRTTQFGLRLRELREAAGLSQSELGEKAGGIAAQNIAKYERGVSEPTWPTVLDLAEALGISTEQFRDELPPSPKRKTR